MINELYDNSLDQDQTFSASTNVFSGEDDSSVTSQTFRNDYTVKSGDVLYASKSNMNDDFEWTFPLTVLTILVLIMMFLGSRYIYQKYVSKTLLSDKEQEAAFWTNKTI